MLVFLWCKLSPAKRKGSNRICFPRFSNSSYLLPFFFPEDLPYINYEIFANIFTIGLYVRYCNCPVFAHLKLLLSNQDKNSSMDITVKAYFCQLCQCSVFFFIAECFIMHLFLHYSLFYNANLALWIMLIFFFSKLFFYSKLFCFKFCLLPSLSKKISLSPKSDNKVMAWTIHLDWKSNNLKDWPFLQKESQQSLLSWVGKLDNRPTYVRGQL